MNVKTLISEAEKIGLVSNSGITEYQSRKDLMIAIINEEMSNRKDILALVGADNLEMMKDNHANHALFMSSIFNNYIPEQFVNTILWVFRAYQNHGFSSNYWAAQLNLWKKIINENLSAETAEEIIPYYEWMIINIPVFVKLAAVGAQSEHDFKP